MSKKDVEELPTDWIQRQLTNLRRMAETGTWPSTADQLITDIALHAQGSEIEDSGNEMLSIVADDALAGHDIAERYPAFYAKMVANPRLFAAFIDVVHMLEADQNDSLEPLPAAPSSAMPFLHNRVSTTPQIIRSNTGGWRITWELVQDQLNKLLFPNPDVVYRYGRSLLEDESLILIHDEITIAEHSLELLLEAIWPVDQPEILRLQVMVAADESTGVSLLQTRINWGDYSATAVLDDYGRALFPDAPLNAILSVEGQLQTNSLQLILEQS